MSWLGRAVHRNLADVRQALFWKALLAEFIGTLLLVFACCSASIDNTWNATSSAQLEKLETSNPSTVVQIALVTGLGVSTAIWCTCHVSGGHVNPAVTVAMFVTNKITFVRSVFYVGVQCAGAVVAVVLLKALSPPGLTDALGYTRLQAPLSAAQGCGVEAVISFILALTAFASCDGRRRDLGGSVPLTIGLAVTLCCLFAVKYTGASMNPARSFGPTAVGGDWNNHWVYWCGPLGGAVLGGLLYESCFAVDASVKSILSMIMSRNPENEEVELHDDKVYKGRDAIECNSNP